MVRWLIVVAAACLIAAPAAAEPISTALDLAHPFHLLDTTPVPAEWSGIWNNQISIYMCGQETPLFSDTSTDTICTGEAYEYGEGGTTECSVTVTPTTLHVECAWDQVAGENCTAHYDFTVDGTRNGNSSQQTVIINVTYTGLDCGFFVDSCTRTVITGTRVAPEPVSCQTPVEATRWGAIKAFYR